MSDLTEIGGSKLSIVRSAEYRHLLADTGLSQRRLAELCGVHEDTVSRWGSSPPKYVLTILRLIRRAQLVTESL